jgi:thiamine biosynthesis lipoprotein
MIQRATWRAIGTSAVLLTEGGDHAAAREAVVRVLADVDMAYSRFRPDSELSQIRAARGTTTTVSPLLGRAIEVALAAAARTDGAVDPTVGRAMRAIGYDADFAVVAGRLAPVAIHFERVPGWQAIRYESWSRALHIPVGVELDLGSTGKALASDMAAAAALEASGASGVLVSLGGDIATAGTPPEGGWRILAAEDSETPPDAEGEVVAIDGGALATSSITVRHWRTTAGVTMHHLIDPRTGAPVVGPWRTAAVVAPTCVEANALATATIVMGEGGRAWLDATGAAARLVAMDGTIVRLGGWPDPAASAAA